MYLTVGSEKVLYLVEPTFTQKETWRTLNGQRARHVYLQSKYISFLPRFTCDLGILCNFAKNQTKLCRKVL